MMEAQQVRLMSAYNRVMNERIYAVCAELTEAERRRDRQAFFGSIHGTLNHMLLVDRLWFGAFVGKPVSFGALDEELYASFDELHHERVGMDAKICAWADQLLTATLNAPFQSGGGGMDYPLWAVVTHFFNHQTHHRGQITVLLSQQGVDYGVTDLPWVPGVIDVIND